MYISTIVFGIVLFFFLWRGYRNGLISSLARIISWAVAYPAAIFLTGPFSRLLLKYSPLQGLLVYFVAGGIIFLVTSIVVEQLLKAASNRIPEEVLSERTSKIGGAVIGVFVGGFVGLLVGYAVSLAQEPVARAMHKDKGASKGYAQQVHTGADEVIDDPEVLADMFGEGDQAGHARADEQNDTFIDSTAKKLVGTVAATAIDLTLDDTAATELTRDFIENPQETLRHVNQLSSQGHIHQVLSDPEIRELLSKGDVDSLLENEQFGELMKNEHMQALLANAGDGDAGKSGEEVAAETMVDAWRRTNAIKNDPRVQAILEDPEFQRQISAGNKFPLLVNPQLKLLTDIIFDKDIQLVSTTPEMSREEEALPEGMDSRTYTTKAKGKKGQKTHTRIYEWTDEQGGVHFSNTPRKE